MPGVNLGGWLVLEPFITPGIFQRYPGAVDEFTLTRMMREQGTLAELEDHYATFIVGPSFLSASAIFGSPDLLDRTRYRRNCQCRVELAEGPVGLLGRGNI